MYRILTRPFLLFYDKTLEARKWFWHYMALKQWQQNNSKIKQKVNK
jgi:hypothetical protein